MKQRNYSIDLLKLYFALLIAVTHTSYPSTLPYINGDYVVTLFFLLSGFFLVRSFDSGKYADPWQYTFARVRRIGPYYVVAFVAVYLYFQLSHGVGPRALLLELCRSLPDLTMVYACGFMDGGINYPMWQLSALMIVSHIFFALLKWDRQLTLNALCPLMALLFFTYYVRVSSDTKLPFVYIPTAQAGGAVAMGMLLHEPISRVLEKLEASRFPGMPALVSGASVFLILLMWTNRTTYAIMIPFAMLLVCLLYSRSIWARWFKHPRLAYLDKLTLGIYLNHALIVRIIENHPNVPRWLPGVPEDITFLLIVVVYTVVMMKTVDLLMELAKKCRIKAAL